MLLLIIVVEVVFVVVFFCVGWWSLWLVVVNMIFVVVFFVWVFVLLFMGEFVNLDFFVYVEVVGGEGFVVG